MAGTSNARASNATGIQSGTLPRVPEITANSSATSASTKVIDMQDLQHVEMTVAFPVSTYYLRLARRGEGKHGLRRHYAVDGGATASRGMGATRIACTEGRQV